MFDARKILCLTLLANAAAYAGTPAPPPVQNPRVPTGAFRMHAPGFEVTPLPVKLTNINNVAYGPDGRLYCAGYDGRIHVLSDSDGDGLEDRAEIFWNKSGDILCPIGMVVNKDGVFVCTQGRIARLRDTSGDGIADECVTVASGWSEKVPGYLNRRVDDCIGLAIDTEGNYYIGLGTANYENPYVLDKTTKDNPKYDRKHVRGSMLKISADGKTREILSTGLRFTVGIEINRHGDLFCTDQEGSTWLPTGNPYDELIHIVKDRHYGFPPRHEKWLPDVFDEPSTVDIGPTHQSTCGFRFNDAVNGRKLFGPEAFADNVFITGQSRGKLFRAQLAKTAFGYVGRPSVLASIGMLPTDLTFSSAGAMVMACHSGRPDWGNGPNAEGTLFKIKSAPMVPVPAAVWAASPLEVRVTFTAPIDPKLVANISISGGKYAREGDHLEPFRPGYAVVKLEQAAPRHKLAIRGTQLSEDRRELRIATAPHPWHSSYSLSLAATTPAEEAKESFELAYNFYGVEAQWFDANATEPAWSGWLPHLDLDASRGLTVGSNSHDNLWAALKKPGRLVLRSTLTSTWDKTVVLLQSPQSLKIRLDGKDVSAAPMRSEIPLPGGGAAIEIELPTGGEKPTALSAGFRCESDTRERPLFLYQQTVPWAPHTPAPVAEKIVDDPQLAGGDPAKGRAIFFGEGKCNACHTIHGEGSNVGPDLTNQSSRHREAIHRDIVEPNATINPDYLAYLVQLKDGRRLEGTLQTFGTEKIKVMDATGKGEELLMSDVKNLKQSKLSFMPEGFKDLGVEKLRDLLAFLTEKKQ